MAWDWEWEWCHHSQEWRWRWVWRPDNQEWRSWRQDEPTLQEHWDGTAAPSQEEQGGQAVGSQGPASQDRRGKKQTKPSAIRQDRELEAAYQKVAAHRAQQRPDAPRLSRSSYMRNRSRPPKAVRQGKGGGKDRARREPASQDGAPPGVRPPPPKPERSEQPAAAQTSPAPAAGARAVTRTQTQGRGLPPLWWHLTRT